MERPRLKPFLSWARLADEVLLLQGGGLRLYLHGESVPALAALLPELDGQPIQKAAAAAGLGASEATELVEPLAARGVLDDGEDLPDSPLARALSPWTHRPRAAAARIAGASISVDGTGDAAAAVARAALEVGLLVEEDAPFTIVARDAPLPAPSPVRNSVAFVLDGPSAWVGPTWLPGHACSECLASRLQGQMVRPEATQALEKRPDRVGQPAVLPTLAWQAAAMAVQEALFVLSAARPPALLDAAAELGIGALRVHPVLPVPDCTVCGGPQ